MINKFLTVLFICLTFSCSAVDRNGDDSVKKASKNEEVLKEILKAHRSGVKSFSSEEKRLAKDLYNAVYGKQSDSKINQLEEALEAGADPNYCKGEQGWVDANPLSILSESAYTSSEGILRGLDIPKPSYDLQILNILTKNGADINLRPYIWQRVSIWSNADLEWSKEWFKKRYPKLTEKDLNWVLSNDIRDINMLIEAFLEAGADPDMLGHPYPYSREAMEARITDEEAREYFKKGTRAINVAIEKGIAWESQVDLLLKYTTLDEESLKAAERSNDPLMIEKINKLWESK